MDRDENPDLHGKKKCCFCAGLIRPILRVVRRYALIGRRFWQEVWQAERGGAESPGEAKILFVFFFFSVNQVFFFFFCLAHVFPYYNRSLCVICFLCSYRPGAH